MSYHPTGSWWRRVGAVVQLVALNLAFRDDDAKKEHDDEEFYTRVRRLRLTGGLDLPRKSQREIRER